MAAWTSVALVFTAVLQLTLCLTQQDLNYIGRAMNVRVRLTDNLKYDGKRHTMVITLTNSGNRPINTRDLEMFFHSFFMVEPDNIGNADGYVSTENGVKVSHINGMLFKTDFLRNFGMLLPKQSKEIKFNVQDWAVSKTDVPNNWYVTSGRLNPVTLASTAVEDQSFVDDFVDPNQYKRYNNDQYSPFTPIERFSRFQGQDLGPETVKYDILPTPKMAEFNDRRPVAIDSSWVVSASPKLQPEAVMLGAKLGIPTVDIPRATNVIVLEEANLGLNDPEGYILQSMDCASAISIKGESAAGVFYGIQSLLSLLTENGEVRLRPLPGFTIIDDPRYEYRGMHLDVARNFHPKETVMDLIDTMAQYKLNKLHLHMSDDEAWRLDIPQLPELTTVGGRRCHDTTEQNCLIPQLGSGPQPRAPGSGFYRREDYRDILQHAANNHVEVIPEFQLPSHARAAIKSMEERYRRKNDIDNLLTDLEDNSKYMSVQMFKDDAINPCIESTYNFLKVVIRTLKEMHDGIDPLKIFNLGGEAVPEGAWVNSTACRKAFPNVAPENLPVYAKAYFMSRLAKMVIVDEGMKLAGYEDAFWLNDAPLPGGSDNLLVYPYQNVWEWGLADRAYKFANERYPVVLSPVTHLSFDHPYEPDPNERGLYWASRYTDAYKTFSLRPDNLYDNIDVKRSGETITRQEVCGIDDVNCEPLLMPENVKGIQAFGWTELIKDRDTLNHMLFPRVLALAERAWHQADWENTTAEPGQDWERFANKVGYRELPKLDRAGVNYRVPLPAVSVSTANNREFTITLKTEFPGLVVQYSMDGGSTWADYSAPFNINDINLPILLRTQSSNGARTSRSIRFAINDLLTGPKK